MKILLINPFSKTAAVRQGNLARALSKKGHWVTLMLPKFDVYSRYQEETIPKEWKVQAIHPRQFKGKRLEWSYLPYIPSAILKSLRREFDVIHAFRPTPFSGLLGLRRIAHSAHGQLDIYLV